MSVLSFRPASLRLWRSFSTTLSRRAESATDLVKAPVQVFGLEGRYATALYSAAVKQQKLETVEGELNGIQKLFHEDKKFHDFVLDPTLKKSDKQAAVEELTKSQTEVTRNFFSVLASNGRLPLLDAVAKSFQTLMSAKRGEVTCEVVTAKPLDAASTKELHAVLQKFVKPNEKLQITARVDPSLIAGMKVTIGDKYVDMSFAAKLQQYEKLLRQPL